MSLMQKKCALYSTCYKKKDDLKKNESHAKLANGDENSIDKPGEIALKFYSQIKEADMRIDSGASHQMTSQKKSLNDYSA